MKTLKNLGKFNCRLKFLHHLNQWILEVQKRTIKIKLRVTKGQEWFQCLNKRWRNLHKTIWCYKIIKFLIKHNSNTKCKLGKAKLYSQRDNQVWHRLKLNRISNKITSFIRQWELQKTTFTLYKMLLIITRWLLSTIQLIMMSRWLGQQLVLLKTIISKFLDCKITKTRK